MHTYIYVHTHMYIHIHIHAHIHTHAHTVREIRSNKKITASMCSYNRNDWTLHVVKITCIKNKLIFFNDIFLFGKKSKSIKRTHKGLQLSWISARSSFVVSFKRDLILSLFFFNDTNVIFVELT